MQVVPLLARSRERATNVDRGQMVSMAAKAISARKNGSAVVLAWLLVPNQKAYSQYSWSLLGEIRADFFSKPFRFGSCTVVCFSRGSKMLHFCRKGGACAQPTIAKCLQDSARVFLASRLCWTVLFFSAYIWRRFSPKRKGIYGTSEVHVVNQSLIFGCLDGG